MLRLIKVVPVLLASLVALVLVAGPAAAAPGLTAVTRPWHYWISVVLAASFLGMVAMLALGYVVKVVFAKYGIKVGRRQAG